MQFRKLTKCEFCDVLHANSSEIDNHVRSMHPEKMERIRQRMYDTVARGV